MIQAYIVLHAPSCLLRIPAMTAADHLALFQVIVTAAADRSAVN